MEDQARLREDVEAKARKVEERMVQQQEKMMECMTMKMESYGSHLTECSCSY
jgi:hypothetical protein